ncbi:MAG: 1-acyl-sn-glycerol-3-phosphate acyltransferase, partial [Gammaproteobacteria bacterium]|nr:1-acyl-sn-glycerol-3-phosphate acyltransferase [Gammaproteobacteria bacterium]
PTVPVVVLSNHQSQWETILFYKLVFPVVPILKHELLNIPFWGWALRFQKPIAIDRSKPGEAGRSLLIQGADRIRRGYSIIIFPEGTRSLPGKMKRFSRGGAKLAVAAGAPILPIAHNAGDCWPPRSFIKYPGVIRVTIGAPIETLNKSDAVLTALVETWIAEQLQRS